MTDAGAVALAVRGLEKSFAARRNLRELLRPFGPRRRTVALAGVSLSVRPGELVALLGPNGAGKTTLMKIVAGLVTADAGEVEVDGLDLRREQDRARARVGYVLTEERSFFWRLDVAANLRFFAALAGLSAVEAEQRIRSLAALLGLDEHLGREFSALSAGQRQRVAIARGLLVDPPVVLFDEATRALDPGRAERLRRLVREVLVARGRKAVLFATHDLGEAEALSDRVILMAQGRIAAEGPYREVEPAVRELFREEARAEDAALARLFPDLDVRGRGEVSS